MEAKLIAIQAELKAPKSQYNSFGKYHYRNVEDILEALKPHLEKNGLLLTLSDEIVQVGDRIYVKATAYLQYGEKEVVSYAYARESDNRKGMDDSQLTGSTSSYARKYALNGMFLIDDTKDADSMDNSKQPSTPERAVSHELLTKFRVAAEEVGFEEQAIVDRANGFKNDKEVKDAIQKLEEMK